MKREKDTQLKPPSRTEEAWELAKSNHEWGHTVTEHLIPEVVLSAHPKYAPRTEKTVVADAYF